jgi:hypothetical protein
MVDRTLRAQLATKKGAAEVQSVVVRAQPRDASNELERTLATKTSKREKLAALAEHHGHNKRAIMDVLKKESEVSVSDLPGTPDLIVTASLERLRELLRPGSVLDREPTVNVLPNAEFHTLAG